MCLQCRCIFVTGKQCAVKVLAGECYWAPSSFCWATCGHWQSATKGGLKARQGEVDREADPTRTQTHPLHYELTGWPTCSVIGNRWEPELSGMEIAWPQKRRTCIHKFHLQMSFQKLSSRGHKQNDFPFILSHFSNVFINCNLPWYWTSADLSAEQISLVRVKIMSSYTHAVSLVPFFQTVASSVNTNALLCFQ